MKYQLMEMENIQVKNLLNNSGFENGIKGWSKGKGCEISSVNNNSRSGNNALMFSGTKCGVFQKISNLKPNTTYKVSGYIKSQNSEAGLLKVRFYGGKDITRRYSKPEYGLVTATFKTGPDNTSARIALLKYADGATGKTWFDDISVVEVGTQIARAGRVYVTFYQRKILKIFILERQFPHHN